MAEDLGKGQENKEKRTSCSRYQLQICMFPLWSSMHLVNCVAAPPQLSCCCCVCCVLTGAACCSAGAASLPPPEKRPPMAWPTEEPTATPLKQR